MSKPLNQIYPDQAIAICTREQAEEIVDYDHHVVNINGRAGVMLTYQWMPLDEQIGPFVFTVVFHFAERHPRAPQSIQAIMD